MEETLEKQVCPICKIAVTPSERYPKYLCNQCTDQTASADGRPLGFFNTSLSGGFYGLYANTRERYDSHICYVNGKNATLKKHALAES